MLPASILLEVYEDDITTCDNTGHKKATSKLHALPIHEVVAAVVPIDEEGQIAQARGGTLMQEGMNLGPEVGECEDLEERQ